MTIKYIKTIEGWTYDGVVTSIYIDPYYESHKKGQEPLRGPGGCYGYVVLDGDKLMGMFEYYLNEEFMEIGLAVEPNLKGKGLGKGFVNQGIKFGIKEFYYDKPFIRLSVDKRNVPAIRVYEKVGFSIIQEQGQEYVMQLNVKKLRSND